MSDLERGPIAISPDKIDTIDTNIRGLVVSLNSHGIRTEASCEGHIGQRRKWRSPWISFRDDNIGTDGLLGLQKIVGFWNRENPEKPWQILAHEEQITRSQFIVLHLLTPTERNFQSDEEILKELQVQASDIAHILDARWDEIQH